MVDRLVCDIYRSQRKEGVYLYVEKKHGLSHVPQALKDMTGSLQHSMTILLQPGRELARAKVEDVVAAILEKGFYLQLPPTEDDYMQQVNQHNSKLSGV